MFYASSTYISLYVARQLILILTRICFFALHIYIRFPNFDFSEVVHDEDVFYSDERESDEHCCERAVKFLQWLNQRPEKCIAVVTHSSFLRHLFGQFGESLHDDDRDNLQRLAGNCELRSIVLASHGNKDGKQVDPLMPPPPAPSTVRMKTIVSKEGFLPQEEFLPLSA